MPERQRSRDQAITAFGQRVRAGRSSQGMTQEALAERAELHPTFISNVERGYRVLTVPTLLRLAKALDVPASELVDGIGIDS